MGIDTLGLKILTMMNSFQTHLQLTILITLLCSGLLLVAAVSVGYISVRQAFFALIWALPILFALALSAITLILTDKIEDARSAARFNSMALAFGGGLLTLWAHRVNSRVGGVKIRQIGRGAWALIIATAVMTVIESINLVLWSATEPVVWGVIWLDIILVLQVAVLVLGYSRESLAVALRVQPDSSTHHPHGSPNAYPDSGYYSVRGATRQPNTSRNANPSSYGRPVTNALVGTHQNARHGNRVTHAPRKS